LPRRDAIRQSQFRKKRNRNIFALGLGDTYRIDPACELCFEAPADFWAFETSRAARHDKYRTDLPDKWRGLRRDDGRSLFGRGGIRCKAAATPEG
jgi:hypothetical protein